MPRVPLALLVVIVYLLARRRAAACSALLGLKVKREKA
jgi:hypothetical protein